MSAPPVSTPPAEALSGPDGLTLIGSCLVISDPGLCARVKAGAAAAGLPVPVFVRRCVDAGQRKRCDVPGCDALAVASTRTDGAGPWLCRRHADMA